MTHETTPIGSRWTRREPGPDPTYDEVQVVGQQIVSDERGEPLTLLSCAPIREFGGVVAIGPLELASAYTCTYEPPDDEEAWEAMDPLHGNTSAQAAAA